jgi:hypothetical protein
MQKADNNLDSLGVNKWRAYEPDLYIHEYACVDQLELFRILHIYVHTYVHTYI